jgi:hypothetical protein
VEPPAGAPGGRDVGSTARAPADETREVGPVSTVESTTGAPVALKWEYDDRADPSQMTVYDPGAEDPTTAWLTVDVDCAVPLDGME